MKASRFHTNKMTQEDLIKEFLTNPSDDNLVKIGDRYEALRQLHDQPDTASKLLFLYENNKGGNKVDIVRLAVEEGNREVFLTIVKQMDHRYRDILVSLQKRCAVLGRTKELIYLLSHDEDKYIDITWWAAKYGHKEIVDYMINNGYKKYSKIAKVALSNGHNNLYNRIVERAGKDVVLSSYDLLKIDAERGNLDLSKVSSDNVERLACLAARGGHLDLVNSLINVDANNYVAIMEEAIKYNHIPIVSAMIKRGVNDFEKGAIYAAEEGYLDIVNLLLNSGCDCYSDIAQFSIYGGHLVILDLVIDKIDPNNHIADAAGEGHKEIVEYLFKERVNRLVKEIAEERQELCKIYPID